jgi:hypothetical protein
MKSGQNVWLWLTLGATTFGVVTACTAADGGGPTQSATCTVGSYNCTCNVDGSCQPGLVCTNGLCAVPGDGTGGGSAVGTGGGSAVGTGGGAAAICAAGQQQSCLGPGDCVGTQTCLADGTAFGPCVCPIVGSGGAPTGVGGAPGMGGANVQVCVPNSVNPCYGTANCLGSQTCLADGSGYTTCDCTSAGSGGAATGSGGAATGSGGAATGSGGAATGSGGAATGSGGAATGSGGAATGSGGAATGSGGSASCGEHTGDSGIIPDDEGNFIKDWNVSGLVGSWYTYADDGGSTIESAYTDPADPSSIGNSDGEFCFSGTSVGHNDADYDTNWGSAVAFDVCKMPDDTCFLPQTMRDAASAGEQFSAGECPSSLTGVTSITFTISGTWSTELRLNFKQDASDSVQSPFVILDSADTYTITAASAEVPDWADNYPETGVAADILSIQFQFSSMAADTTFDVCLSNITVN